MDEGFEFLESGKFVEAKSFFGTILNEYPENKTANLCYGRAIGLSGDPEKAIEIFSELLDVYQGDQEIRMNLAEAHLWKKDPKQAIPIYQSLLIKSPENFGINLGIANSYSMDRSYKPAHRWILSALRIEPENLQAQVSAKYIRLGYANELASQYQSYDSAVQLIHQNLEIQASDQESLALLANIYIIAKNYPKADSLYRSLKNPTSALVGQSTTLHLLGKDKEALVKAEELLSLANEEETSKANFHYISALLWNKKIQEADQFLDSVRTISNQAEVLAKEAEIAMYEADFKKGAERYGEYLKDFPNSFNGNMGKANALHALGMDNKSYEIAYHAKLLFPGQQDVQGFLNKLDEKHSPKVENSYFYGQSSDQSTVQGWTVNGTANPTPLLSLKGNFTSKRYSPPGEGEFTESESIILSGQQQINDRIKINASIGRIKLIIPNETETPVRGDIDLDTDIWVNKNQKVNLGYATQVQDFNAALANQNLKTQHFFIKNSMFWNRHDVGWYTELYQSYFSDSNRRNLLFSSIYKSLPKKKITYKAGLNLLLMKFQESNPSEYYSPLSFTKGEVFGGLTFANEKSLTIAFDVAAGLQVAETVSQGNWRSQASITKSIGRLHLYLKGLYTTISEIQGSGFSYTEARVGFQYRLALKPLFNHRFATVTN